MGVGMGPCGCISLVYGVLFSAVALFVWCLTSSALLVLTRSASADTVLHWMSGGVLLLLSTVYGRTAQRTYLLTQWAIGAAELQTLREKQFSATVAALAALFGTGFALWLFGSAPPCTLLAAQEPPPLQDANATVVPQTEGPECTNASGTDAVTGAVVLAVYHTWVLHKLTVVEEGRLTRSDSDTWSAEVQDAELRHSRRSAALANAEVLNVSPQARP